ncbi:MAG TPA: T3SS effector HopA1 family protein [Polyangia bacterium]
MGNLDLGLSSLLTNVWENRSQILFETSKIVNETVGDRVYGLCGASLPKTTSMTASYSLQLERIRSLPNLKSWQSSRQRDLFGSYFLRFSNPASSGACLSRVYVNAKLDKVYEVFSAITALTPPVARLPGWSGGTTNVMIGRTALVHQGRGRTPILDWSVVVLMVKIADVDEAFTGRRDVIVIYLNQPVPIATQLAQQLSLAISRFVNHDVMPMTQLVSSGISVGAEVHGQQGKPGASFTETRCGLIARGLIDCVLGPAAQKSETSRAPLTPVSPPPATANRLAFVARVEKLFTDAGISVEEPWL